jgi:hypothetical protein
LIHLPCCCRHTAALGTAGSTALASHQARAMQAFSVSCRLPRGARATAAQVQLPAVRSPAHQGRLAACRPVLRGGALAAQHRRCSRLLLLRASTADVPGMLHRFVLHPCTPLPPRQMPALPPWTEPSLARRNAVCEGQQNIKLTSTCNCLHPRFHTPEGGNTVWGGKESKLCMLTTGT